MPEISPLDPTIRLGFAMDALNGLSVGDALGEAFGYQHQRVRELQDFSIYSQGSVCYTDDTAMALGIVECLKSCKTVEPDTLARIFGRNFNDEPERGYGRGAQVLLRRLAAGGKWQALSPNVFGGGSYGNGSAMRVAPLGAYFCDDLKSVTRMAEVSAKVTHFHEEGVAGAIAVAVAAAVAARCRGMDKAAASEEIWQAVLDSTPEGATASGLRNARAFDASRGCASAAKELGCGQAVACQDTVPFAVWNACRCLDDFREALLSTVEVGGDCDTNAAIVCGIVAAYGGTACIPPEWLKMREPLPVKA